MESKNNISLEECYEKYKEYISKQKMDPDKKLEIKKQVELIIENKNKYEKIIEKFYENSELEYNNRYLRLNIEEKMFFWFNNVKMFKNINKDLYNFNSKEPKIKSQNEIQSQFELINKHLLDLKLFLGRCDKLDKIIEIPTQNIDIPMNTHTPSPSNSARTIIYLLNSRQSRQSNRQKIHSRNSKSKWAKKRSISNKKSNSNTNSKKTKKRRNTL
uniref:Uncharacterized protein n=1 Tax=viral metagenome TaxID=1070528 RepID=A0A6C0HTN7_9ZZZZ